MKGKLSFTIVMVALSLLIWSSHPSVKADNAADIDHHSDVREAMAIADASSGVCAEVDAAGNLQVDISAIGSEQAEDATHTSAESGIPAMVVRADSAASLCGTDGDYTMLLVDANGRLHVLDANSAAIATDLAAIEVLITAGNVDLAALEVLLGTIDADTGACATDLAAIEVLITASNVDLDALETLVTAGNVDLAAIEALLITMDADTSAIVTDQAAIEVLLTAANVDHAANEVLLGTIDADTSAMATDLAAIEVLLGTIDTDTGACATDLAAIEVLITAGNVDLAALEVDLAAIEVINAAIQTAVEIMDDWDDGDTCAITPDGKTGVVVITDDAVVKGSAGTLYGVRVAFDGVTAGDTVEVENHASADSGTSLLTFVAQAADENVHWFPCVGIAYAAGIYCDFSLTGGAATVSFVYE